MNVKYPLTESFSMTFNGNHQDQTFILNSFSNMYEDTIVLAFYLFGKFAVFLPYYLDLRESLLPQTVPFASKLDN